MSRRRKSSLMLALPFLVVAGCAAEPSAGHDVVSGAASSVTSPGRSSPPPSAQVGEELTSVSVPGAPLYLEVGFGSLWVATGQDDGGVLVRVDPATNRVVATVPVGGFPVGIAFGAGSVWQANHADGTLTRIDARTNTVVATIPVGPGPAQVAVQDGMVWVADQDSTLVRVDPATNRRVQVVRVGRGKQFRALVAGAGSVWTANDGGGITRVEPVTGRVLATIPIAGCCGGDLMYAQDLLWASNPADGRLFRIDPAVNRVVDHIQLDMGAGGMEMANGWLWVAHGDASAVSWHEAASGRKLGGVTLNGGYVGGMAVTDQSSIWVQTLDRNAVIRLATGMPAPAVPARGSNPVATWPHANGGR